MFYTFHIRTKVILKMGLTTLIFFSSSVFASDTKVFPGTFCVGDGPASSNGLGYSWGVRAENSASDKRVVNCPIVRDAVTDGVNWSRIYVYDSSSTDDVECRFQSWNYYGSSYYYSEYKSTGSSFTGLTSLYFSGLSTANNYSYNLICKLPPNSYISSYQVDEP